MDGDGEEFVEAADAALQLVGEAVVDDDGEEAAADEAPQLGDEAEPDYEEAPASPSTILVAAQRAMFAAAPAGCQPCTECMAELFRYGKDRCTAGFVHASGMEEHYKSKHRVFIRKWKRRRSRCSTCFNWFASVAARKAHQRRFGHK